MKRFFSTVLFKTLLFCVPILFHGIAANCDVKPTPVLGKIARIDAAITSKQHYRQHPLDDEISELLFDEYFKTLDPGKIYFTQEDINSFRKKKKELDDQINAGNTGFAFDVYNLLVKKVQQYQNFAKRTLKKGFDFNKDEELKIDRSKGEWPLNEKELEDVWRKKLKNDILTLRLMEKARLEKKKEDKEAPKEAKQESSGEKESKAHESWRKTPEEKVLKRIEQYVNYLDENDPIEVLELYLSSFKKVYDPHSAYLSPNTLEDFNISMKLSLVGIGALLTSEDGYTKIVKLIPGGPAEKDGQLKPEDRIIAVAQETGEPEDIIDMPLSKVVRLIRGAKNTKVRLTILDGTEGLNAIPKDIELTRDTVKLKESEAKGEIKTIKRKSGEDLKIGIITLPSFYLDFEGAYANKKDYKSSTRDVKKILDDFNEKGVDGVVLDIRSNGGGSLLEAINLTGLFIKDGPVVQIRSNTGAVDKRYDPDSGICYSGPLIVMVNRFSASASEIFAGAIQDYSRGILVGDSHTHGKGTVQTIFELNRYLNMLGSKEPAGSLKLTTAKFYRINGASTQEKGVTPDIVFPNFNDTMELGEKYLDHALPWDSLEAEEYEIYNPDMKTITEELVLKTGERIKDNKKFQLLKKDIDLYKKMRDRKTISLNEKKRWKSYLEETKIFEEQNKLLKQDEEDSATAKKKKDDKEDKLDLYLEETMNIMRDYIALAEKARNTKNLAKTSPRKDETNTSAE